MLEKRFPGRRLVFIFDHSPIHRAKADDALNAHEMNVWPGGVQSIMRPGWWVDKRGRRREQLMVDRAGQPKGLHQVLTERGLFREGMVKADMVPLLAKQPDFAGQPTLVEDLLSKRGHHALFLPKFHCELNPVERIWATAKRYTRERCKFRLKHLRKLIPKSLSLRRISLFEIQSYFQHCGAWVAAYAKGLGYTAARDEVKAGRKQRQAARAERAKADKIGSTPLEGDDSNNSSSSSSSDNEDSTGSADDSERDADTDSSDSDEEVLSSDSDQEMSSDDEEEQSSDGDESESSDSEPQPKPRAKSARKQSSKARSVPPSKRRKSLGAAANGDAGDAGEGGPRAARDEVWLFCCVCDVIFAY